MDFDDWLAICLQAICLQIAFKDCDTRLLDDEAVDERLVFAKNLYRRLQGKGWF